ncbi:NRAMP family divalent metal transporter [Roseibium sp. RKSG952]|uniref:NRAMP family divalent metal transporter n=1 Tax=Roseibium sp. RKSG952 TaxID=2529384 RepID=UPI0012BC737A|nr:divalent metal cation transporter [Roseibium sp. RKSG952]MTH97957.1 divalent metal cation transporter [Roseibium sp. RKSG952]
MDSSPHEPGQSKPAFMSRRSRLSIWLAVMGPGLVVMLADTDAGSLITAAQSGAQWGYQLLLAQFILIPILIMAQELTVRLGIVTQRGHGELIRQRFGKLWAAIAVVTLVIACAGAIVSEMSGIAGVGHIWGIPSSVSVAAVVIFLGAVVVTGSYRRVELIALSIGLFELVFLIVMVWAKPDVRDVAQGLVKVPLGNPEYLYLLAANIGAVIMPWMIFYQQSAVVDKGLTVKHLKHSRWDTVIGAIITQVVMASVLIAVAATIGKSDPGEQLETVEQISHALTPFLGEFVGQVLFSLGMVGAALVAAIVVSCTAAWGLGELTGYKRSLSSSPREAPWFYLVYAAVLVVGAVITLSGVNLIDLNVGVQVMNALLLPIVLGFLFALSIKTLPEEYRLKGIWMWAVGVVVVLTAGFGVYAGVFGAFGIGT